MKFWSRHKQDNGRRGAVQEQVRSNQLQTAPARYCCSDLTSIPFGTGHHLVYNKLNRSAQVLSSEMAELLNHCRSLLTLDEHAAEYQRSLAPNPSGTDRYWVESIRGQLSELVAAGLLVSDAEILKSEATVKSEYVIPEELLKGRGLAEARHLSKRLVYKFGQLLYWWPEMMAAARKLRAQSQRLAMPI